MSNTAVTLTSASRVSDVVTLILSDASLNTYTASFNLQDAPLTKPAPPTLATAATGGTVLAGTYNVSISYTDASGETVGSGQSSIVTTGTTSTITITSPPANVNATGWYAYVSSLAAPLVLTRQQTAGSPTAVGTNLTLTAPPTTSGANPLTIATDAPVTNLVRALFASS